MKIPAIKNLDRQSLAGASELPSWIDPFLSVLNQFLNPVVTALMNRLSFADNFDGNELTYTFIHNVQVALNPMRQGSQPRKIKGVSLIDASGQVVTGFGWVRNANNTIGVTVQFSAGGSTSSQCVLQVQYG